MRARMERYLKGLETENYSEDVERGYRPRNLGGLRRLALGVAFSAALLGGCKTSKYVDVTSEPAGADAYVWFQPKSSIQGEWRQLGKTPVRGEYWYDGLAYSPSGKTKGAVAVKKDGFYPQSREFTLSEVPPEWRVHFNLVPDRVYSFRIETEPAGAMVEYMGQIFTFDPQQGRVPTGKFDWMTWGNTPLDVRNVRDEMDGYVDGMITIRVTKPGHKEKILNLSLGNPVPKIELEKKEDL